jgi:hypothetical protein
LASTQRVLARAGTVPGQPFGDWPDSVVYQALLRHDTPFFARMADQLALEWVGRGIENVVSDAAEGYNPVHDVCRLVVDRAVQRLQALQGVPVGNYEFSVVGAPGVCPAAQRFGAAWLRLSPDDLARKLAAARGYPELAEVVETALADHGPAAFAVECLRPVVPGAVHAVAGRAGPHYESFGRHRVAAGRYRSVIRYRDHLAPLAAALAAPRRGVAA